MIWKAIGRLLVIPIGLALAGLAASAVALTLGMERLTHAMHGIDGEKTVDLAFDALRDGSLILAGATVLPALAVVVIGEVGRIRSLVYYVAGGGLALAAIPVLAAGGGSGPANALASPVWPVLATAGFAGGFIYWLIAGRGA